MSKFVEFLQTMNMNTTAAQYIHEMEQIIFRDPSSAIIKGRKFLEVILKDINKYEMELDDAYQTFSLYEKINILTRNQIIDSRKIQKAFDTVRIIGNKAAHHSDTNEYADAFKAHKEIYNIAIWYYNSYFPNNNITIPVYEPPTPEREVRKDTVELLQKLNKFESLLESKGEANEANKDLGSLTNHLLSEKVKLAETKINSSSEEPIITNEEEIEIEETSPHLQQSSVENDIGENESCLEKELSRLKTSSKEAIENAGHFSEFKDYLHVDRPILNDLKTILQKNKYKKQGNLILLCGNVGDGKSHVLAYLNNKNPELLEHYKVYNDATESFSPYKDSLETLEELLSSFSDEKIDQNKNNIILAINMGVLHNFVSRDHEKYTYNHLISFVDESQLFTPEIQPSFTKNQFNLLSFSDYNSFELTEKGATSTFYSSLLKKIVNPNEDNPFYQALLADEKKNLHTVIHDNYKLLQNEEVKKRIIQLIIQSIITEKLVISARAFLNFIADTLLPDLNEENLSDLGVLDGTLPNLLFGHQDKSDILQAISKLDPLHSRSNKTDRLVIALNTLDEWDSVIKENIQEKVAIRWLQPFFDQETLTGYSFDSFFETFIRLLYLLEPKYANSLIEKSYIEYIKYLYHFNKGDRDEMINFYEKFKKVLLAWKGSPKKDYIFINMPSEEYRIAQKIDLRATIKGLKKKPVEVLTNFKIVITLEYKDPIKNDFVTLDIDYPLYTLLSKVKNGYRPNRRDVENAIQFTEFVDKILKFGDQKNEILIYFKSEKYLYSLKRGDFDPYVFEKEDDYNV